jgi:hypothetical protein
LGGRPALDLGCSAASNVVAAEPLNRLTAFLTEKLCVSWCSENVSLVSKFRTESYFFFVVGATLGRANHLPKRLLQRALAYVTVVRPD